MSVHRKGSKWAVRYRDEARRNRSRSFDRKADADRFDAEATRRRQLGVISTLDAGRETLNDFVSETWVPTHAVTVSPRTRQHYASLYDFHLAPYLGDVPLQKLRPELIARWQADRLQAGGGRVAVAQALTLLGNILQRALEAERIAFNPARLVRRARAPRRQEVRPLAPATVERMRAACGPRDAMLISVLAYAGLRPSEALALRWGDVRDRTMLIQRALSLGAEDDTKTTQHRTVRVLGPLKTDLAEWRMLQGRPGDDQLLFPGRTGEPWSTAAYQSCRGGPSPARPRRPRPSTRRPTHCATPSPACCSTRAAASSTSPASSATTPASRSAATATSSTSSRTSRASTPRRRSGRRAPAPLFPPGSPARPATWPTRPAKRRKPRDYGASKTWSQGGSNP